jgi:hypothetical protein
MLEVLDENELELFDLEFPRPVPTKASDEVPFSEDSCEQENP